MMPTAPYTQDPNIHSSKAQTPRSNSSLSPLTIQYHFLVIGYGDEHRGDDGVGPWVARAVADWQIPSVKALAVPQLRPDLTSEIAKANHVIFVDACDRHCAQTVQVDPLVVCPQPSAFSINPDQYDPCTLLQLTHTLYGRHPRAWLLQVAAECFEGECQLSATADHGGDRALQTIAQFFTTYRRPQWASPTHASTLL